MQLSQVEHSIYTGVGWVLQVLNVAVGTKLVSEKYLPLVSGLIGIGQWWISQQGFTSVPPNK